MNELGITTGVPLEGGRTTAADREGRRRESLAAAAGEASLDDFVLAGESSGGGRASSEKPVSCPEVENCLAGMVKALCDGSLR